MSNNLGRTEVGATQNQKTVTINDSDGILDAALTETIDHDFTSGNIVVTADEHEQNFEHNATNLSVARTITFPATKRFFFVNNENGTATLDVIVGATSIQIALGENGLFYADGTTDGLIQTAGGGGGSVDLGLLDWKQSVRVATAAAGTLASDFENGDTVDGVVIATADRILLKDQASGSENGVYTVNSSGAPTRATDYDDDADVTSGAACYVEEGDENAQTIQVLITTGTITVDSTSLVYAATFVDRFYEVGGAFGGAPGASVIVFQFLVTRNLLFPSGLSPSQGFAGTAATAQTDFDLQKNSVSFGTMRWAAAGTVATFIAGSDTSFVAGDRIEIIAPGSADATLADLIFTLSGIPV